MAELRARGKQRRGAEKMRSTWASANGWEKLKDRRRGSSVKLQRMAEQAQRPPPAAQDLRCGDLRPLEISDSSAIFFAAV